MTFKQIQRYHGKAVRFSWPWDNERRISQVAKVETRETSEGKCVCMHLLQRGKMAAGMRLANTKLPGFEGKIGKIRITSIVQPKQTDKFGI
jgi:hypothetical protein